MYLDLHVKYPVLLWDFNGTLICSGNFRKGLKFCERAYRTLKMQRFLVHQQSLESAVKNVFVSRRSSQLPTTSLNYVKEPNTILIAVDYFALERVYPDSRRTGRAAIGEHPVAVRKGLSSDKRYLSDKGCDNSGQGSTDQTEYKQYYWRRTLAGNTAVWKEGISCPLLTRTSEHLVLYWHTVTEGIILINDISKQRSYGDAIGSDVPVTHCQPYVPFCIPEEPGCVLSHSNANLLNQPRVACGNYWPDLTTTLFLWCHLACSAVVLIIYPFVRFADAALLVLCHHTLVYAGQ
jgi:hypothetical protein